MLGMKLGIDFGSSSFTVFADGKGVVLCQPSVMVCDGYSGKVIAYGNTAKNMCEKLPASMRAVYPIKDGVVTDRKYALIMLRKCINNICFGKLFKPNVLMCVPSTATPLQKKTVFDIVTASGAGKACFVDEALASAIGAGVSLTQAGGTMVCDIGGGVTDCCVVTMGNMAVAESVKTGGNDFTKAITEYVAKKHKISIGIPTAEDIKITIGSAVLRRNEIAVIGCGKRISDGVPSQFEITSEEVYEILKPHLKRILSCVLSVLEKTPPELCGDIAENGIILAGGSAKLFGIDEYIEKHTKVKTVIADKPEECAVRGIGILLKDMKYLDRNGYIFKSASDDIDESSETDN